MKKIVLLLLLVSPFYVSAQTDTITAELSTKDKFAMLENGGCYFFDFNKILTGTADKELLTFTNSLLKKIGTFSKENKSKVTLLYITNLSQDEYESRKCTDAENAFTLARAKLGMGVKISAQMIIYDSRHAYGLLKILIE